MTYVSKTDSDELSVNRGVQILLADTNSRVTQLEKDQLRLLDLIEKMVEMDKIRAQAFDLLDERVKRAAVHAGLRQQAIDALNERITKLEQEVRQS